MASKARWRHRPNYNGEWCRRRTQPRFERARRVAKRPHQVRISIGWCVQLQESRRIEHEINACLWRSNRHQHEVFKLLALGRQKPRAAPLAKPNPGSNRTNFEKYGFIWGGHWYHYDTMHFEYRPELLAGKM